jgi:hypothetical protein
VTDQTTQDAEEAPVELGSWTDRWTRPAQWPHEHLSSQVPERPSVTRLRQLFGAGFGALTPRHPSHLPAPASRSPSYRLPAIDPTGAIRRALQAAEDSAHLVRPDGHLAAVWRRHDAAVPVKLLGCLRCIRPHWRPHHHPR